MTGPPDIGLLKAALVRTALHVAAFACGCFLFLLSGDAFGVEQTELSRDHQEALQRGCRYQVGQESGPRYLACISASLDRIQALEPLTDIGRLPAGERRAATIACTASKDKGLSEFELCLREQAVRRIGGPASPIVPQPAAPTGPQNSPPSDAVELYRRLAPTIYVVLAHDSSREKAISQGSAVGISANRLLTNCHVIGKAKQVALLDGDDPFPVAVESRTDGSDRCVLRSDTRPIRAAPWRATQTVQIGEKVYTLGNPRGLQRTLADGLVSGIRTIKGLRFLQTNAPVSPGSSGGGLFDAQGRLIGITTFLLKDAQGLNFAIAVDEYMQLPSLRNAGHAASR